MYIVTDITAAIYFEGSESECIEFINNSNIDKLTIIPSYMYYSLFIG